MGRTAFYTGLISKLAEAKQRMMSGERIPCPRCGGEMERPNSKNPYSADFDVRICKACSAHERDMAAKHGIHKQIWEWAYVQPKTPAGDFKATEGHTAWAEVERGQLPMLLTIFERYFSDPGRNKGDVRAEYDFEVRSKCKGVARTDMFTDDVHIHYRVADDKRLTVLISKASDGGVRYCASLSQEKLGTEWLT